MVVRSLGDSSPGPRAAAMRSPHRDQRTTLPSGVAGGLRPPAQDSYLVDSASSHMLVSKIKPCMSKYKQLYTVKLRTAHYISNNLFDGFLLHG